MNFATLFGSNDFSRPPIFPSYEMIFWCSMFATAAGLIVINIIHLVKG